MNADLLALAEELRAMAANGRYYPCDGTDARLLADLRDAAADLYAALGAGDVHDALAADDGALRTPLAAVEVTLPGGELRRTWLRPEESVPAAAARVAGPGPWTVVTIRDNAGEPARVDPHTLTFVLRGPDLLAG